MPPIQGGEIYIVSGDRSLPKAIEEARQTPGPHTILMAPGRYFNESGIVLDDRDSGLTIRGEQPGAVAEIYGGAVELGESEDLGGLLVKLRLPRAVG